MQFDPETLCIIHYPDPRLRKPGRTIDKPDESHRRLAERMFELMRSEDGVGLAAPQVGLALRLFICNVTGEPKDDLVFINPALSDLSDPGESEEGCLSIPEVRGTIRRYLKCRITGMDLNGKIQTFDGVELAARCWQHECDHLDGKLILDRFSEADKIACRRKLKELDAKFRGRKPARA